MRRRARRLDPDDRSGCSSLIADERPRLLLAEAARAVTLEDGTHAARRDPHLEANRADPADPGDPESTASRCGSGQPRPLRAATSGGSTSRRSRSATTPADASSSSGCEWGASDRPHASSCAAATTCRRAATRHARLHRAAREKPPSATARSDDAREGRDRRRQLPRSRSSARRAPAGARRAARREPAPGAPAEIGRRAPAREARVPGPVRRERLRAARAEDDAGTGCVTSSRRTARARRSRSLRSCAPIRPNRAGLARQARPLLRSPVWEFVRGRPARVEHRGRHLPGHLRHRDDGLS